MPVTANAGFRQILASEWTKFGTVRSTVWAATLIAISTVAIAVLVGITGSLQPDDTILGGSLTGAVLGQIAAAALGVLVISSEYGSGTIRATLTACPRRTTVLAAKTLLVAGVAFVAALTAGFGAYLTGLLLLDGDGYATGDPLPALIGVALNVAAVAVLGLAAGAALRHAAGAITAMLLVLLVPTLVGPLLGSLQPWASGASPLGALQKLSQTSDATAETVGSLGAWPSLWTLYAYTAVVWAGSAWILARRDS